MRWVTAVQSLKGMSEPRALGRKEQPFEENIEWYTVPLKLLRISLHRLGLNCNYGLVL